MILKFTQLFLWLVGPCMILVYSFNLNLTRRSDKRSKILYWTTILAWATYSMTITWMGLNKNRGWDFCYIIIFLIHLQVCYEEKILYKIFIFFINYIIQILTNLTSNVILKIFSKDAVWIGTDISLLNTVLLIIAMAFEILFIKLLSILIKRLNVKEFTLDKSLIFFFLVPVSQYLLIFSFFSCSSSDKNLFNKLLNLPILICGIIIALVADLLLFKGLIDNSTAQRNKLSLAELEYEHKLSLNYYENIRRNADQFMKYRHDFNNILGTAYHLIQSDDDASKQQGLKLLDELFEKNKSTAIPWYCKNTIVTL